jgi:hypothetical protein
LARLDIDIWWAIGVVVNFDIVFGGRNARWNDCIDDIDDSEQSMQ